MKIKALKATTQNTKSRDNLTKADKKAAKEFRNNRKNKTSKWVVLE